MARPSFPLHSEMWGVPDATDPLFSTNFFSQAGAVVSPRGEGTRVMLGDDAMLCPPDGTLRTRISSPRQALAVAAGNPALAMTCTGPAPPPLPVPATA